MHNHLAKRVFSCRVRAKRCVNGTPWAFLCGKEAQVVTSCSTEEWLAKAVGKYSHLCNCSTKIYLKNWQIKLIKMSYNLWKKIFVHGRDSVETGVSPWLSDRREYASAWKRYKKYTKKWYLYIYMYTNYIYILYI